jgi:arsenical pump membrane protein
MQLAVTPLESTGAIWGIAAAATGGVILRPWRVPEFVWATLGAIALVGFGLLEWTAALSAIGKGTDVYLFLVGMMLLAELARKEGLFDWLAARAVRFARGSAKRLFILVYGVGILVTVFLSNDATAVVLTPAVYAAARAAKAEPLPYLFVCAFIANAASFVLPISNPANLVLFAGNMPALGAWLAQFALPSVAAIAATYAVLRFTQRRHLHGELAREIAVEPLSRGGREVAVGILLTGAGLIAASAFDVELGLPTCLAGLATAAAILLRKREAPWAVLRDISWGVLPLVAGLFVLVEGLQRTGVIDALGALLRDGAAGSATTTAWGAGVVVAFACNLLNNLPAGLIASAAAHAAHSASSVKAALLIGVDLGPNLSITGSLATLLWLVALRREGEAVGALAFLRLGVLVMPPALVLSMAALLLR